MGTLTTGHRIVLAPTPPIADLGLPTTHQQAHLPPAGAWHIGCAPAAPCLDHTRRQSRQARTCREYTGPLARPQALTPPSFPSPLVFLETQLCVLPPPLPAGSACYIFSLSGFRPFRSPSPHPSAHRTWPSAPQDLGHPLPHRHSRGDSRPLPGPRIFPLATWGAGRSQAMNFLLGWRHPSGGWMGSSDS